MVVFTFFFRQPVCKRPDGCCLILSSFLKLKEGEFLRDNLRYMPVHIRPFPTINLRAGNRSVLRRDGGNKWNWHESFMEPVNMTQHCHSQKLIHGSEKERGHQAPFSTYIHTNTHKHTERYQGAYSHTICCWLLHYLTSFTVMSYTHKHRAVMLKPFPGSSG